MKNRLREAYDKNARKRDENVIQNWKLEERSTFLSLLLQEQKENLFIRGCNTPPLAA